jgi:hypothetical protein
LVGCWSKTPTNAKKSEGAKLTCFADASDDSKDEDGAGEWSEWNRRAEEFISETSTLIKQTRTSIIN